MKKPLLSELTLEEKIGQLLLGYQWDINRKTEVDHRIIRTPEEKRAFLEREKFGTLWAQTGDGNRGTALNYELNREKDFSDEFGLWIQEESDCYKIPALTALDAEREGAGTVFGDLTATCPPPVMGATNDEELIFKMGAAIARELRCAGCNWRWTPVIDLCGRYTTSVLRSYAPHDYEKQGRLALAHALGMQSEGVAATAKHFPGGDGGFNKEGYRDAHFSPSQTSIPFDKWEKAQGKVFQTLIDGGVYSIMISHMAFLSVDDSKVNGRPRPSTISKKVITDLLKNKMGFKGVVITDGIVMGALYSLLPYDELIVEIVNAGNDVILGVQPNTGEIIKRAVEDGRIDEARIDDACNRILDMKEKLGMFDEGYRLVKGCAEKVKPITEALNKEVARKGITLMRDRYNYLPINKADIKKVTIICSTHADHFVNKLDVLKKEFESRGAAVTITRRLNSNEELAEISKNSDLIIYAVYVGPHEPMGPPSLYGAELKSFLYAFTSGKEKSIGVSFGYPYIHHDIMENCDTFVNAYGWSVDLMRAFVEGIYGEIEFKGIFPLKEYGE